MPGLTGPPPQSKEDSSLSHETVQDNDDSLERISQRSSNDTVNTRNLAYTPVSIHSNYICNEVPIPVLPVQLSNFELISNASDDYDEENKQFDEEEADDDGSIASNDSGNTFGDGPQLIANLAVDRECNLNVVNIPFSPINIVAQNVANTVNNDVRNDVNGNSTNEQTVRCNTESSRSTNFEASNSIKGKENSRNIFGIPTVYAKDVTSNNTEKDVKIKSRPSLNSRNDKHAVSSRKENIPIRIGSTGKTKVTTKRNDSKLSSDVSHSKNVPKVLTIDMRSTSSSKDVKRSVDNNNRVETDKSDSPKKEISDFQKSLDQVQSEALDKKLADIELSRNKPDNAEFLKDKAQKIAAIRQVIVDQSQVLEELKKYTGSGPDEDVLIQQGRALLTIQDSINHLFRTKTANDRSNNLDNDSDRNVSGLSPSSLVNSQDTTTTVENAHNKMLRDEKVNIRLQSQLNNLHELAEMEVMKFHVAKSMLNKNKLSDSDNQLDVTDVSACDKLLNNDAEDDDDDADDEYGYKTSKVNNDEKYFEKLKSDETPVDTSELDSCDSEANNKKEIGNSEACDLENKVEINPELKDIKGQLHDVSNVKPDDQKVSNVSENSQEKTEIMKYRTKVDDCKSENKAEVDLSSKDIDSQFHEVSNVKLDVLHDKDNSSKITDDQLENKVAFKPSLKEVSNVKEVEQKTANLSKKLDSKEDLEDISKLDDIRPDTITVHIVKDPKLKDVKNEILHDISNFNYIIPVVDAASKKLNETTDIPDTKTDNNIQNKIENTIELNKDHRIEDKKNEIVNSPTFDDSKCNVDDNIKTIESQTRRAEDKVENNSKLKDIKSQTIHDVSYVPQRSDQLNDFSIKPNLEEKTAVEDSEVDNKESNDNNYKETNNNKIPDKEQKTNFDINESIEMNSIEKKSHKETIVESNTKPKVVKTLQGFSVIVSTELIKSHTVPLNPASTIIVNNLYKSTGKDVKDNENSIAPKISIMSSESTSKTYNDIDNYETQNINIEFNTNKSDKDGNNNQINSESYTVSVLDNAGTNKYVVETETKGKTQILIKKQTYDRKTESDSTEDMNLEVKKEETQAYEQPINKVVNVFNVREDPSKSKEVSRTETNKAKSAAKTECDGELKDSIIELKDANSIDTDITNSESEQNKLDLKSSNDSEGEGETKIDLFINEVEIIKDNQLVSDKPVRQPQIVNNHIDITIESRPNEEVESKKKKQESTPIPNPLSKDTESKINKKDSTIIKLVNEVHSRPVENTVRILHSNQQRDKLKIEEQSKTSDNVSKELYDESETEINFSIDSESLEERHDPTDIMKSITSSIKKENVTSDLSQLNRIPAIVDVQDSSTIEVDQTKPMFNRMIHHPPHARVNVDGSITPIWQTPEQTSNKESFLIQVVSPDKTPSASIAAKDEVTDGLITKNESIKTIKEKKNIKDEQSNNTIKEDNINVEQTHVKQNDPKSTDENAKVEPQNNKSEHNENEIKKDNENKNGWQENNVVSKPPVNVVNILEQEANNNAEDSRMGRRWKNLKRGILKHIPFYRFREEE